MIKAFLFLPALILAILSCTPPETGKTDGEIDLIPPVLDSLAVTGPRTLELTFDETPRVEAASCQVTPELSCRDVTVDGRMVTVTLNGDQAAGREYSLRLAVRDAAGNGLWLLARFYGFNPSPPRLLINEFTTRGSSTHPDLVELKVIEGGNLGGVTFCHGSAALFAFRFVFPPLTVAAGDFILLHAKPEGLPEEIDETDRPDSSGGRDASPAARDFWVRDGAGLSGNNGALTLYASPDGRLLDAVLYSTRTSDSDTAWRGFGSYDLREQADEISAARAWLVSGTQAAPEDAVNPDGSTATRSVCRSSASTDTDGRDDFHIVPTRMASFGRENSDEVFVR